MTSWSPVVVATRAWAGAAAKPAVEVTLMQRSAKSRLAPIGCFPLGVVVGAATPPAQALWSHAHLSVAVDRGGDVGEDLGPFLGDGQGRLLVVGLAGLDERAVVNRYESGMRAIIEDDERHQHFDQADALPSFPRRWSRCALCVSLGETLCLNLPHRSFVVGRSGRVL